VRWKRVTATYQFGFARPLQNRWWINCGVQQCDADDIAKIRAFVVMTACRNNKLATGSISSHCSAAIRPASGEQFAIISSACSRTLEGQRSR
jgi:hypothetical protein